MARRLIITAGWLAAAILAALVGLLAVNVIGDGLTSPIAQPISQDQVQRELATLPSSSPPAPAPPSPTKATAEPLSKQTRGGTVVARCDGDNPVIVSLSPAQGFEMHERHGADAEFRGTSDNHDRVKIAVSCSGSGPTVSVRDDD